MRTVDLSHEYYTGMPHAGTIPPPAFREALRLPEDGLRCMELTIPTHLGTHIDAPSHFITDGRTIDQISPGELIGPAFCVPVDKPADTTIEIADLEPHCTAASHGDALLIRTGWDDRYGFEDYGRHPYLAEDCAQWIADRGFRLVGIDTVTPEMPVSLRPRGYHAPVHTTLLGRDVLIVENLALREVVGERFTLVIGALRITGGDGSPARVFALFDQ